MRGFCAKLVLLMVLFSAGLASAATYTIPSHGDSLVGEVQHVRVGLSNVVDIMQKYDVGFAELSESNPGVNLQSLSASQTLTIPTQFILPTAPHKDIVVNIGEMRLFYYPAGQNTAMTYPVGIGKEGRMTPIGTTFIWDKAEHPEWKPTSAVRDDFLRINGYPLPTVVMPGPDNPLGDYSMSTGFPDILIHGSIDPSSIGQRASAGCIHMFNCDIAVIFPMVTPGHTHVTTVYEPFIAGWSGDTLYFVAHTPITKDYALPDYKKVIQAALKDPRGKKVKVDWDKAAQMVKDGTGIPQAIS